MNPVRLFALQSARVPPGDMQPGATAAPEIDSSVAAAICHGMPERWYRAAMYKWGGDHGHREWLFIELWMETIAMARRDGWKRSKAPVARCGVKCMPRAIDSMGLLELADYEEMLTKTEGTKEPYIVADIAIREVGQARHWGKPEHWAKKVVALGVSQSTWFRTWDSRVAASRQILEDWASRGHAYANRAQMGRKTV